MRIFEMRKIISQEVILHSFQNGLTDLIVYNLPEKTQNIKIDYLLVYQAGRRIII